MNSQTLAECVVEYWIAGLILKITQDNPVFLRQRERIAEGLRKAGIPEE